MARTSKRNPRVVKGTPLQVVSRRATDAKTWKAGEFGAYASGVVQPAATNAVEINCQFLQDQTTNTSSSDVWVGLIPSSDTIFEGYVSNGTADASAPVTMIGVRCALVVGSNYHTIDNGTVTNKDAVVIDDVAWKYAPLENDSTDSPGKVRFHFPDAILDYDDT
jgi:hypothetical protein